MVESSGLRNLLEECCDDKSKIDRLRCNFEVHDNQKQVRTNCKIKCKNGHEKRLRPLLFNKNGYYWNQTRPGPEFYEAWLRKVSSWYTAINI